MPAESIAIVKICNMALTLIGEPTITSLAEQSKAARLCDLRYQDVRDAVLRAHPWSCATKRIQLAASAIDPVYEYANLIPLPADFLRLIEVGENVTRYSLEGRTLLCDSAPINIKYIYRVTDPTEFDSLLTQAIATRLAAELCLPLARSADRQQNLWAQYKDKLSEARFINGAERSGDRIETNEWLTSRFGSDLPFRKISE